MSRRGKSTIARMRGSLAHMMLWMCVGLTLGGCMGPSTRTRPSSLQSVPSNRHPTTVTSASNQPVRVAAESELGSEAAANIPEALRALPAPPDPGAAALVDSMLAGLGQRQAGPDGITTIGVRQVRNQSRCSGGEFGAFRERFAQLLNHQGRDSKVRFSGESDAVTQYELQGAAYLTTTQGFDVWELYLSLTPSVESWAVWTANGPVHVLRTPRPGQPQVLRIDPSVIDQ